MWVSVQLFRVFGILSRKFSLRIGPKATPYVPKPSDVTTPSQNPLDMLSKNVRQRIRAFELAFIRENINKLHYIQS